jgi:AcrR family transcriptional regulator
MSTPTRKPLRKNRGAKPKPTPKRTQPQRTTRTRTQILKAAAEVFGRLGYMDSRVEDILEESGVSRPTFYRFFDSKEAVFDALDEQASLSLMATVESAVNSAADPLQRLDRAVEAFLRWLANTGPLALALHEQSSRPDSQFASRREATIQALTQWLSEEVEKVRGEQYDPVLFRSLLGVVELVGVRLMHETPRLTEAQIERGTRISRRIVHGALVLPDDPLPPIPKLIRR